MTGGTELLELRLGKPGHGGITIARRDGQVVFVRYGLPGELVRAVVTEDRGGSFLRADAVEILEPAPGRHPALCPVAGPGGAGCCDLSHATLPVQRDIKAQVLAEQLLRLADVTREIEVEELAGTGNGAGWRTRLRLVVDEEGHAGVHRYHDSRVLTDLRCPQPVSAAVRGIGDRKWQPGAELQIAVDSAGTQHVVELEPARVSAIGRRSSGRRGATARRAARSVPRRERVRVGTGRPREQLGERIFEIGATDFWQAHRGAAQTYSDTVAAWSEPSPGATVWDLYAGAGVFAARLADRAGTVVAVEASASAVRNGELALADRPEVAFRTGRVDRVIATLDAAPEVVVLDPPRAGAGREVVEAVTARGPKRIVHIGCDPASFARDTALYRSGGYRLAKLRAFDAFPLTHHVEAIGLFVR